MSIKLRDTVRTVRAAVQSTGEAVGILAPDLADAQTAATEHRQSLVTAQNALEAATLALQAAHDAGGENAEIERMEAALAAAKLEATRAEARYRGAENRLTHARNAEAAKAKDAMREKFEAAMAIRTKAAEEVDRLAVLVAEQVHAIEAQDDVIRLAQIAGVASSNPGAVMGQAKRAAELSLSKHGAIPRAYMGDPTQHPDASEIVLRGNGALLAA